MDISRAALTVLITCLAIIAIACGGAGDSSSKGAPDNDAPVEEPGAESSPTRAAPSQVGASVGKLAPAFTLTLDNGEEAALESLRQQGRPVVLFFFTTW